MDPTPPFNIFPYFQKWIIEQSIFDELTLSDDDKLALRSKGNSQQ
jgi:hypothetical protein